MSLIRALQIILHLPIFYVVVPANVVTFFSTIIPIAMFDILENDYGLDTSLILDYDDEGQEELNTYLYDQLENLGYGSHNLLGNLNTLGIVLIFYFIQLFFLGILAAILKATEKKDRPIAEYVKRRCYNLWYESLIFGSLIMILIEGYIEFLICGYLSV